MVLWSNIIVNFESIFTELKPVWQGTVTPVMNARLSIHNQKFHNHLKSAKESVGKITLKTQYLVQPSIHTYDSLKWQRSGCLTQIYKSHCNCFYFQEEDQFGATWIRFSILLSGVFAMDSWAYLRIEEAPGQCPGTRWRLSGFPLVIWGIFSKFL